MAQVLGIGGVFFRARDPKSLAAWYATHLGVTIDPSFGGSSFLPEDLPKGAYSIWSPFPHDTKYFEPSPNDYMINLIVDDLDEALDQVKEGGAEIHGEPEHHGFGLFGWFTDPEGNKVELWQPNPEAPDPSN